MMSPTRWSRRINQEMLMSKIKVPARTAKKAGSKPAVSPSSAIRKQSRQVVPAKGASVTPPRKRSVASNPRRESARKTPAGKGLDSSRTTPLPKRVAGKTARVANLIQRPEGASLADLMAATGWQAHSVRGMISGVLRKKEGIAVILATGADGARIYRVAA